VDGNNDGAIDTIQVVCQFLRTSLRAKLVGQRVRQEGKARHIGKEHRTLAPRGERVAACQSMTTIHRNIGVDGFHDPGDLLAESQETGWPHPDAIQPARWPSSRAAPKFGQLDA
jgi:hypothetical protein